MGEYCWQKVIKPEDNPFTDAELAGAILWGATFYGFNRHNRWTPFEEIYSKHGEKAWELERKQYLPYIRNKKTKYRLRKDIGFFSKRIAFLWKNGTKFIIGRSIKTD